jgi:cathepsin B
MRKEILENGPIVTQLELFQDFKKYKGKGIYVQIYGASLHIAHAVKIIGWGVENDVPYWIIVNSWGKAWSVISWNST